MPASRPARNGIGANMPARLAQWGGSYPLPTDCTTCDAVRPARSSERIARDGPARLAAADEPAHVAGAVDRPAAGHRVHAGATGVLVVDSMVPSEGPGRAMAPR